MKDNYSSIVEFLENKGLLTESFDLEFKSAKGGFPKSFWETYSSFANTEGGIIILGISEKDDQCFYDGLPQVVMRKFQDDFWNQVNNREKVSFNLLLENDVQMLEIQEGQFILAFRISCADYRNRPVYIGSDPIKGTYKRCHTGDYKCTPDEVKRMLADSLPDKPDSRILENYTLEDLDEVSVAQYRQLLGSVRPGHPFLKWDDKGLLLKLGGWKKDRYTGKEGLTVAGLLMFGKTESIVEAFPDYHVDYQEIPESGERWIDRVYPDGTWEANLFQFFHLVWPKVSRSLPKTFKLKNGQRHDEGAVHEALREALANTLIHADYFGIGGVVIKKYTDCFLFSNPGCLLISQAQYYKGGISVPRNNSIQTMFLLLGYGEKAGSGSTRIMNAWEGAHWRKPLINVLPRPDRVELCLSMEQLLPQKSINKLISVFGEEITHLYGDGLIALTTAEMEGCVSNVRLQQLINKHSTEISQLLKDLCNEGYLVAENKGRWTVYHLNLREEKKSVQKNLFEETMTPPVRNDDTSGEMMTPPVRNDDTSGEMMTPPVRNDDTSGETMTPRGKKWMRNEELMTLVVEICCDTFKSVDEIAAVILRTPTYLKNKILPLLLAQERLERLYPTIPNHPNQAYRKKQK